MDVSRRKFLSRSVVALVAALAAAFGVPAIAFVLGPSRQREHEHMWVNLGPAERAQAGKPALYTARVERTVGWRTTEEDLSFYVQTDNGTDFRAFSNVCPHLGCRVRWVDGERQYFCPCHNAAFNEAGEVASGPPPRPLDGFEIKEEDGDLLVHWDA